MRNAQCRIARDYFWESYSQLRIDLLNLPFFLRVHCPERDHNSHECVQLSKLSDEQRKHIPG